MMDAMTDEYISFIVPYFSFFFRSITIENLYFHLLDIYIYIGDTYTAVILTILLITMYNKILLSVSGIRYPISSTSLRRYAVTNYFFWVVGWS